MCLEKGEISKKAAVLETYFAKRKTKKQNKTTTLRKAVAPRTGGGDGSLWTHLLVAAGTLRLSVRHRMRRKIASVQIIRTGSYSKLLHRSDTLKHVQ